MMAPESEKSMTGIEHTGKQNINLRVLNLERLIQAELGILLIITNACAHLIEGLDVGSGSNCGVGEGSKEGILPDILCAS
jgi:hypothetical protein